MWKNSDFSIRSRRNGTHNDIVRLLYLPQIYNNLGKIMVISRKKEQKHKSIVRLSFKDLSKDLTRKNVNLTNGMYDCMDIGIR